MLNIFSVRVVAVENELHALLHCGYNFLKREIFAFYYFAIHICVPISWYTSLRYLSCERAQRYQLFGTQISIV